MSDVHEALRTRATVHAYDPAPLPAGCLDRALEAAINAPNHRMTEPWRFVVVGRSTRASLVEIAVELKAAKLRVSADDTLRDRITAKMLDPAELVVVTQALDADPDVAREDYAAIACAILSLMLSLHADGVGAKWSTGAITRDARTYEHLRVDPERERIVGFVWAGVPGKRKPKPPRRRQLTEIVRRLP